MVVNFNSGKGMEIITNGKTITVTGNSVVIDNGKLLWMVKLWRKA